MLPCVSGADAASVESGDNVNLVECNIASGRFRDLSGHQEEGFTLHFGCLILGITLAAGAVFIPLMLGWRWLWLVPAGAVAFWALIFVISVFESRWLAVTRENVRRGVPANCANCGEALLVAGGATRYKTTCPICGHSGSGRLLES